MSNHTPGPWTFENMVGVRWNRKGYVSSSGVCVGFAYSDKSSMHVGEAEANGRLIAAAPDLLEACEALANEFEVCVPNGDESPQLLQARAAIELATKLK